MNKQLQFYENKLAYEMDPSDLYNGFETSNNYIAIDARQVLGFNKEQIPTAINIPHKEINLETTKHLDITKIYVIYCDGIGCNASTKGALKMTKLGFKLKELIGGLAWWKLDGYATKGTNPTNGTLFKCTC